MRFTFLASLLISFFTTSAADFSAGKYYHKRWGVEEGLPQSTVYTIAQDSQGYLWFGTFGGLGRFDGHKMKIFDRSNEPVIKSSHIRNIATSPDGSLYFTSPDPTRGGLYQYKNGKFLNIKALDNLNEKTAQAVLIDKKGRIWVATRNQGIVLIEKEALSVFGVPEGVPSGRISTLFEDSQGVIWAGIWEGGIIRFSDNRFKMPEELEKIRKTTVSSIIETSDNELLFSTFEEGIYSYKNGNLLNHRFPVNENVWINALYRSKDGTVWVATRSDGLYLFENGTLKKSVLNGNINDFHIRTLFQSDDGSFWVGTHTNGLYQFISTPFKTIGTLEGLTDYSVSTLVEDKDGVVWIGTHNRGLNLYKNGVLTNFPLKGDMPNPGIRAMLVANDGTLWIGTEGAGLFKYEKEILSSIELPHGLLTNVIYALYEDKSGNIWVGLADGQILAGRNGQLSSFKQIIRKPTDSVFFIFEDSKGYLWFLSSYKLERYHNGTTEDIPVSAEGGLTYIFEDSHGSIWLGTYSGLGLFKNDTFSFAGHAQGLHNESITSIAEDEKGFLWFGSARGVFAVSRNDLVDLFDGKKNSVVSETFGISDGLSGLECNEGQRSVLKTKEGNLWFATVRGASTVDPLNAIQKHSPVRTILESVRVDGTNIDISCDGLFSPDKKRFEFNFTGIEFTDPEKISFRYMIEGFDNSWITGKKEKSVTYHIPDAGNYKFKVAACVNNICKDEASYKFEKKAWWYQSAWIYVFLAAFSLSAGYLLFRKRMKTVEVENIELKEIVEEQQYEAQNLAEELKQKYETSRLEEDTAKNMMNELIKYMEEQKPYLDSTLRLHKVAEDTGIASHYISQILNIHLNKNFYTFVNEYRIEEAKKILSNPKTNGNILDAAFRSGFNSKTAFNTIFKKMTGMTPRDYIKSIP